MTNTANSNTRELKLALSGAIGESFKIPSNDLADVDTLILDCSRVERINSSGARELLRTIQTLRRKGAKLLFTHCTPAVVEFLNFFKPTHALTIQSVAMPHFCHECRREWLLTSPVRKNTSGNAVIPKVDCPDCGNTLEFDDVPEEYFAFLKTS